MTTKDDKDKLSWHLLMRNFMYELTQLVQVLDFGARKYGESNYKTVHKYEERYLNALYRHLHAAVNDPHSRDPDTRLPHYAHVAVNALFLLQRVNEEVDYTHPATAPNCYSFDPTRLTDQDMQSLYTKEYLSPVAGLVDKLHAAMDAPVVDPQASYRHGGGSDYDRRVLELEKAMGL